MFFPLLSKPPVLHKPFSFHPGTQRHNGMAPSAQHREWIPSREGASTSKCSWLLQLDFPCGCHRTWDPAWTWKSHSVSPFLQCLVSNKGMALHLSFHPLPDQTQKSFLPCSYTHREVYIGRTFDTIFSVIHHLHEENLLTPRQKKNLVCLKFPSWKRNSALLWTEHFPPNLLHAPWKVRNKGKLGKR